MGLEQQDDGDSNVKDSLLGGGMTQEQKIGMKIEGTMVTEMEMWSGNKGDNICMLGTDSEHESQVNVQKSPLDLEDSYRFGRLPLIIIQQQ